MRGGDVHNAGAVVMRGSEPWKTERARALRSRASTAEAVLWSRLRNRQLGGFKFVRQFSVGGYFADFTCREEMFIVEIDGGTQSAAEELARDEERSRFLRARGYRVFRVHNIDIYENIEGVLETLLALLRGEIP